MAETFLDTRVPMLDDYLSLPAQSILVEMTFWTLAFLSYAKIFSKVFRSLFRKCRFWYTAHKRGGMFAQNAQDDLPSLAVVGLQHVLGGVLMTMGVLNSDPTIWRHGLLCEAGYEIADLFSMSLSLFPYNVAMKEGLRVPIVCHHIPGIILSFAILLSGLHSNPHLRSIGMWLLLAGGIALLAAFYINTLDFRKDMKKAAFANALNLGFFIYARFWAFPKESYFLIHDVKEDSNHSNTMLYLLYTSSALYSVFNIGILLDSFPRAIRYIKRAYDGVTAIDTEPIPPPKEGRMKRRKSSIVRVMETLGVSTKRTSVIQLLEKWEDTTPAGIFRLKIYSSFVLRDPIRSSWKNPKKTM